MSDPIIPRWEWRTFGDDFSSVQRRIAARAGADPRVRSSDEVYILSSASNDNTKIRNDTMDIKTLQKVDDRGLELWLPVLKERFPISDTTLEETFVAWKVAPPVMDRSCDRERFLSEVVASHDQLKSVAVFKERHGYLIDDLIVEVAFLHFDGQPVQTVAVEMEDPSKVMTLVRELGLSDRENINYVKALKTFSGMPA